MENIFEKFRVYFSAHVNGNKLRNYLLAAISVIVLYFIFKLFINTELPLYSNVLSGAFLGSIITMIVTVLLLNVQTNSEIEKEKDAGIFLEKLSVIDGLVTHLGKSLDDDVIQLDELRVLIRDTTRASLLTSFSGLEIISMFVEQTAIVESLDWASLDAEKRSKWNDWQVGYVIPELNADTDVDLESDKNEHFITIGTLITTLREELFGKSEEGGLKISTIGAIDSIYTGISYEK